MPIAARTWAIVSARLVDEITGRPPNGVITIQAAEPGFKPRVAADGLVGLTGIPRNSFPRLATKNYAVNVSIKAEGYVAVRNTVPIASMTGFPDTFAPSDMGVVFLHRAPVVLRGRTVAISGHSTVALPNVPVQIVGVWNTFPPTDVTAPPPDPPNLISVQPTLYTARTTAASGSVRRRDVVPVSGEDKHLLTWAASSDTVLTLSNHVKIAVGDLLMIDALNPDRVEYITIKTISGASTDDQPARITLTYPLAYEHKSNALVRKVTLQAAGPDNPLARDAISGDTCVFLTSMHNLSTMSAVNTQNVVEIVGGDPAEYHSLSLFSVKSDALGYFRFPPLSRVAQLDIQADRGGGTPSTKERTVSPDYHIRENQVDFIFT